jgi:hypothetical protein
MSALPSKPLPFHAEIGILGSAKGGASKAKLKTPPHLHLDFGAVYFGDAAASPYVGAIDLEQHYLDELLIARMSALATGEETASPRFPGYRLPSPIGQVQLIIKNASNAPVKLLLIPYDVTSLQPGEKTFIRQKLYSDEGVLQYAVHLPFVCPPRSRKSTNPRLYLSGTLRVVFHATPAQGSLHAIHDEPPPSTYAGPGEDWLDARRPLPLPGPPATRTPPPPFDPDGADPDAVFEDFEAADNEDGEGEGEAALTFARRPCTPLAVGSSGLSGSRPSSRAELRLEDALR